MLETMRSRYLAIAGSILALGSTAALASGCGTEKIINLSSHARDQGVKADPVSRALEIVDTRVILVPRQYPDEVDEVTCADPAHRTVRNDSFGNFLVKCWGEGNVRMVRPE